MGFASGFSAGAAAVNAYKDRERQKLLDEREGALHTERMAEIAQAKADRQGMRDAGAERTTMQGTMVTDGGGNKNLYADPVQAARAAEEFKIEAEMREQPPERVTMQAATGITGNMAKGHQITTEPVDLKAINGPEAVSGRFQAELRRQGKPMEAFQMQQTTDQMTEAARQRVKTLEKEGVGEAMAALRSGDPVGAMKVFQASGNQKLPEGAKFVQTDGTDIFTGKPGKVWSVVGPDGATLMPDVGAAAAKFLGIDGLIARDDKMRAEEAAAADRVLKERQVASTEKRNDAMAYKLMGGGGAGGSGGGTGRGSGGNGADGFDPYAGYDPKDAQSKATAFVDDAIKSGGVPVSASERARLISDNIFALRKAHADRNASEQRAQSFRTFAAGARTPQELQDVRVRFARNGFTDAEMARLDPRFALPKKEAEAKQDGAGDAGKGATKPSGPGIFTGSRGETQLLQPLYNMGSFIGRKVDDIGQLRRDMQEQSAGQ